MFVAACDESDGAFEGRKHSAHLVKPSAMPRNIRLQIPRHPSLLSRRGSFFFFLLFQCLFNKSISNMQLTESIKYLLCVEVAPQTITINMWMH